MVALMKFTYTTDAKPVDGYTIRRGIHRGGFGEVYYAVSDAGKEVALKLLTHDLDTELRGVRQCLNLKHPNLVTTFDVKTDADGDHWVIMEYIQGASLEDVLRSFPHGLPIAEVHAWMKGLLDGVEFLHDRGIVHRDLKPANVYRENGFVKIGDVGLSKQMGGGRRAQHTEAVGTIYYMAPEVAKGQYGPEVDVYSLGVMFYEMVTGRLPFDGETTAEILMKHLSSRPDLTLLPTHLRPVIARALEKDPTKRTPTVNQWREELQGQLGSETLPDSAFLPEITNGQLVSRSHAETPHARGDTDRQHRRRFRSHDETRRERATRQSDSTTPGSASMSPWQIGLIVAAFVMPFPFLFVAIAVFFGPGLMQKASALHARIPYGRIVPWIILGLVGVYSLKLLRSGEAPLPAAKIDLVVIAAGVGLAAYLRHRFGGKTTATPVVTPPQLVTVPVLLTHTETWAASVLTGTIAAVVLSIGGSVVANSLFHTPFGTPPQMMFEALATVIATIALVTSRAVMGNDAPSKWSFLAVGAVAGLLTAGAQQFLEIEIPHQRYGSSSFGPLRFWDNGQPTATVFMAYFGWIMMMQSWTELLNPRRASRLELSSVGWSAGLGWASTFLLGLPVVESVVWAGAVNAAAQLAAPWQKPDEPADKVAA